VPANQVQVIETEPLCGELILPQKYYINAEQLNFNKPTVVVIDGTLSDQVLTGALKRKGLQVIHVHSSESPMGSHQYALINSDQPFTGSRDALLYTGKTFDQLVEKIRAFRNLRDVMPISDGDISVSKHLIEALEKPKIHLKRLERAGSR